MSAAKAAHPEQQWEAGLTEQQITNPGLLAAEQISPLPLLLREWYYLQGTVKMACIFSCWLVVFFITSCK